MLQSGTVRRIPQPVQQWGRRVNGVASRYLPNYLGRRWALDRDRISSPVNAAEIGFGRFPRLNGDIAYP
jgi:hypothetical protein